MVSPPSPPFLVPSARSTFAALAFPQPLSPGPFNRGTCRPPLLELSLPHVIWSSSPTSRRHLSFHFRQDPPFHPNLFSPNFPLLHNVTSPVALSRCFFVDSGISAVQPLPPIPRPKFIFQVSACLWRVTAFVFQIFQAKTLHLRFLPGFPRFFLVSCFSSDSKTSSLGRSPPLSRRPKVRWTVLSLLPF